jgi:hypothetical protein
MTVRTILIFILLWPVASSATDLFEKTQGNWTALSKSIYSIYGDVSIDNKELVFSIKGAYKYQIVKDMNDSLVLELEDSLRCGKFIRLGPFHRNEMEFFVYESKEDALLPKTLSKNNNKKRYTNFCSWGVYIK